MQTKRGTHGGVSHVPGPAGGAGGAERPRRRRSLPARRVAAITAALAGVACVAAACSTPKSPTGNSSPSDQAAQALAYSRCMRSHGVPDFPDPKVSSNSGGSGVSMGVGTRGDLNPSNPAFKAASRACRSLQPRGGNPPAQSAQELATDVKFADCMRSNGYPSFPDPDPKGVFNLPSTINPNSAQFGSATSACQSKTNIHSLNMRQSGNGGGS
jgi:hypothetical protein